MTQMGITQITAKTFALLKRAEGQPELLAEGIQFTSGAVMIWWFDGRSRLEGWRNIDSLIQERCVPGEIELHFVNGFGDTPDAHYFTPGDGE